MTTLTASRLIVSGLDRRAPAERRPGLLARLVAVARIDTARRSLADLPPHLRRDIGLGDIDVLDL